MTVSWYNDLRWWCCLITTRRAGAWESVGEGPSASGVEECRSDAMVVQRHGASVKVRRGGEDAGGHTRRLGLGVTASAYERKETGATK
jgi:hypothetical protein